MIRLLYASSATAGLNYRDFLTLMHRAEASNQAAGVTGMLCYGGGQFLQVLEGDRAAVNALYLHIVRDARHSECQLLSVEEISQRDFAEWSMKIVDWNDTVTAPRQDLLERVSGTRVFDPLRMSAQQAMDFLRGLALEARRLVNEGL